MDLWWDNQILGRPRREDPKSIQYCQYSARFIKENPGQEFCTKNVREARRWFVDKFIEKRKEYTGEI